METLLYLNLLTILAYIPIVCYHDIRYREVDPRLWIPMILICGTIATYMYTSEISYPWYSLVISLVMIVVFKLAMSAGFLEGADFLFLVFISLFWVVSPIPYAHGMMQPVFYIYLAVVSCMTAVVVLAYNVVKGNRWGLVEMMSKYPNGVPYMVPISAAFILSVVFG